MKQPLVKSVPPEMLSKGLVVHLRINRDWKQKLEYLAEHDTVVEKRFISVSAVVRRAIQKMFKDRQNTLYPPKKSAP